MSPIIKTVLPKGRIIRIEELEDGTFEVVQRVEEENIEKNTIPTISKEDCILIDAKSLSLEDGFLRYTPKNDNERYLKEVIKQAIKSDIKNFFCVGYSPSFTKDKKGICFVKEGEPAVGKSYNWYKEAAQKYMPERNSRLGTKLEYGALLGVLIKTLVEEGQPIAWAWDAVCNQLSRLEMYWNAFYNKFKAEKSIRFSKIIEDFIRTSKMLSEDNDEGVFLIVGDNYNYENDETQITLFRHIFDKFSIYHNTLGWIVFEK